MVLAPSICAARPVPLVEPEPLAAASAFESPFSAERLAPPPTEVVVPLHFGGAGVCLGAGEDGVRPMTAATRPSTDPTQSSMTMPNRFPARVLSVKYLSSIWSMPSIPSSGYPSAMICDAVSTHRRVGSGDRTSG